MLGIPLQGVNVDRVGDDDTHPFLSAHIPVISIHSVTQETWSILHSPRDRMDAINFEDYYAAYKLAAYYLAYLDVAAKWAARRAWQAKACPTYSPVSAWWRTSMPFTAKSTSSAMLVEWSAMRSRFCAMNMRETARLMVLRSSCMKLSNSS